MTAGMLLALGFSSPLLIPTNPDIAGGVCDTFAKASRALERQAMKSAKKSIGADEAREAAEKAMRLWRHACHDGGMRGIEEKD